jgi:hypothetical protein
MSGYLAAHVRFPEQEFSVICLSDNSVEINPWKTAWQIADLYLADKLDTLPSTSPGKATDDRPPTISEADMRNKSRQLPKRIRCHLPNRP